MKTVELPNFYVRPDQVASVELCYQGALAVVITLISGMRLRQQCGTIDEVRRLSEMVASAVNDAIHYKGALLNSETGKVEVVQ